MTLKLNHQQAQGLFYYLTKVVIPAAPFDLAESLHKDIIQQVFKKLRNKLEGKRKDGYSLQLTDIEAKAFLLYFQNRSLATGWDYEARVIETQLAELDKAYA